MQGISILMKNNRCGCSRAFRKSKIIDVKTCLAKTFDKLATICEDHQFVANKIELNQRVKIVKPEAAKLVTCPMYMGW